MSLPEQSIQSTNSPELQISSTTEAATNTGIVVDAETRKIVESYNDIKKEVKDLKKDFITIFGIFVAFITYVSVEVQLLGKSSDIYILFGLSAFFLAAMLLFAIVLNNLIKDEDSLQKLASPTTVIFLFFIFLSTVFSYLHFQSIEGPTQTALQHSNSISKDSESKVSLASKS